MAFFYTIRKIKLSSNVTTNVTLEFKSVYPINTFDGWLFIVDRDDIGNIIIHRK